MRILPWILSLLPGMAVLAMTNRPVAGPTAQTLLPNDSGPSPTLPVAPATGAVCPLTRAEEKKAVLAFEQMMPVVRHPRCNNCHGGIDPLVPYKQGGHMGDLDTSQIAHNSVQTRRIKCQECHDELPGWDTPGPPMLWAGKTTKAICIQFKEFSTDPADFIGHITNEHGGVQFIETAFKGTRALNNMGIAIAEDSAPYKPEPPPGTHADLIRQGTEWANTVGTKGWTATKECGCDVRESGYVGRVTTQFTVKTERVSIEESATANVYFSIDPDMSNDVPQDYWHSTLGAIQWSSHVVGECHGDFSGTTPMGLGGDDNPMATLSFDPERTPPFFMVAIGPWQTQHYQQGTVKCDSKEVPTQIWGFPMHVGVWWMHAPTGMPLVGDGSDISGSYSQNFGPAATGLWNWSFRRVGPTRKK